MATRQFTNGALNRVALMHALLKGFGGLFLSALLQKLMVLTHNEGAMLLTGRNTLLS
jgi:hypothetical protein